MAVAGTDKADGGPRGTLTAPLKGPGAGSRANSRVFAGVGLSPGLAVRSADNGSPPTLIEMSDGFCKNLGASIVPAPQVGRLVIWGCGSEVLAANLDVKSKNRWEVDLEVWLRTAELEVVIE